MVIFSISIHQAVKKHYRIILYVLCFVCLNFYSSIATARPVSYADGYTITQENNVNSNKILANYSFTSQSSVGYIGEYWRDLKWQFHGVQFNHLLRRWNLQKSQANIYINSGVGVAYINNQRFALKTYPAAFTGLMFDWEDRDYYVSYENQVVYASQVQRIFMQKARIGITPYVGDYGDLHTWLMLEIAHNPSNPNVIMATPMIRFFKDDYLLEAGVSNYGDILVNWVVNF